MTRKELMIEIKRWWHFIRSHYLAIIFLFAMLFIFWFIYYMPEINKMPVGFIIVAAFTMITLIKDAYYKRLEIDRLNNILKDNNIDNEADKSYITE